MSKSIRRRLSGGSDKGTDALSRYLYSRLNTMHKCIADIKDSLKEVLLKKQSEINRYETLAVKVGNYAEQESPGIRAALTEVQKAIVTVNMKRQEEYDRLVTRFYQPIKLYKVLITNTKEEVRARDKAKENEEAKQKKLSTIQVKDPGNRAKISKGRMDLQGAATEVTQADAHMRAAVALFEQKKIADMKTLFLEYIHAELTFHARALEGFTQAYKAMENIQEGEDMAEVLMHLQQASINREAGATMMGGMMGEGVNNEFGIPASGMVQQHQRSSSLGNGQQNILQQQFGRNQGDLHESDLRVPDLDNDNGPSWDVQEMQNMTSDSEEDSHTATTADERPAW